MPKRPKLTVDVVIKRYHATGTYSHAGTRIVRRATGDTASAAARAVTVAILERLERENLDPDFVATKRAQLAIGESAALVAATYNPESVE